MFDSRGQRRVANLRRDGRWSDAVFLSFCALLLVLVVGTVRAAEENPDAAARSLRQSMIWRSGDSRSQDTAFTAFRKTFTLAATPAKAELHLFADVRYLLWINGQYVLRGPCRFDPKAPEYDSVDVRRYLRPGANTLAVSVLSWASNGKMMMHAPRLTAALDLTAADGSRVTIRSDRSWKWSAAVRYQRPAVEWGNVGDRIDMRADDGDWTLRDYDDGKWLAPAEVKLDGAGDSPGRSTWGPLSARRIPLLRETPLRPKWPADVKFPVSLRAGQAVPFALEHLVQAYTALEWEAEPGSELELPYADVKIVSRGGVQSCITSDTHGFMKGSIQVNSGKVTLRSVRLVEVLYPFDCLGRFSSDDEMLNRLWKLCARSVQVMSEDAYVDCCDRERTEWMDCDPPAFDMTRVALAGPGPAAGKLYSDARLLKELLRRTALALQPEGWVKAHTCSDRFDIHAKMEDRACDWVEGIRRYQESTGDTSLVREVWPAVVTQMHWFLDRRTPRGLVKAREWVVWGNPCGYHTFEGAGLNAFIYKALVDAAYLGRLIGRDQQATEFQTAAKNLATAFNSVLWDQTDGTYFSGYYQGYGTTKADVGNPPKLSLKVENSLVQPTWYPALFALDQGIVPESRRASVTRYLLSHCGSGGQIMSVYYLLKQFYSQDDAGCDRRALDLMRQRFLPMSQWEWQTSWEDFDGGSKAHDYGMYPGYFLSAYVLGVQLDGSAANRRLVIQPRLANLKFAEGVVVTELGLVPVSWKKSAGKLVFQFDVPAGATASLRLPAAGGDSHLVLDGRSAKSQRSGRNIALDVAAGRHTGAINLPAENRSATSLRDPLSPFFPAL